MDFRAAVGVVRLTDDKGVTNGFMAEIRICCVACGVPMQFLGLEPGCDTQGARVSIDGLEASIAITPEGTRPNPLQRMAYSIGRFDG
jgi:hypothetical protein